MNNTVNKWALAGYIILALLLSGLFGFAGGYYAYDLQERSSLGHSSVEEEAAGAGGDEILSEEEADNSSSAGNTTGISGEALPISKIYDFASPAIVEITTETVQSNPFLGQYVTGGAGSGVIVSDDGYIATNNHVVEEAQSIMVRLSDGSTYSAVLVGRDIRTDLAVIKIEAVGLTAVTFGDSDQLIVGELAVAIGNPLGQLGGTITEGIVSALDREIVIGGETMTLLQTSAAVNPGNSGGGLFNGRAELIGIVNAKSGGTNIEGLGFAIPVNTAQTVIEEIINFGYVTGRPALGIRLLEVADQNMAAFYRVPSPGVYVYEVAVNSDLEPGDRIYSIEGEIVETARDIRRIVDQYTVGDIVEVIVVRENREIEVEVTLTEWISS